MLERMRKNWKLILTITLISIVVLFVIVKCVQINNAIERQPSIIVTGVVMNKLYVPEKQHIVSNYNANTKRNDLTTIYEDEEYRTSILLLDMDELVTSYKENIYMLYKEGDSLDVEVKRWGSHTRIKSMSKHKPNDSNMYSY